MSKQRFFPAVWAVCMAMAAPLLGEGEAWVRTVPTAAGPPEIDGRLLPGEWDEAALIDDFKQIEPLEGGEPSESTRIYLLVDADNIYVGIECLDSEPQRVIGTQVTRDAELDPDDRVELILDTFLDRRNAYFFQISPGGSKGDALIGNNGNFFSKDWDGIWQGRARRHEAGWSAELAIPAKTLSLRPGLDRWGFNVKRFIKRKNEEVKWAFPDRRNRLFNIASAGTLAGLAVLSQGLGLDIVPYTSVQASRDHAAGTSDSDVEPGVDLRYRLTSSLTATFTVNTDFAETEVDNRVINLSRFPVFFPEKRDFFLEDSGIFSFGGLRRGFLPFFSRRIGLSDDGAPIPILAGAKLTGRIGRFNIGVMDVVTDDLEPSEDVSGVESQNLAVARIAMNVLEESQVGTLITIGDPSGEGDNALAGFDFTYRTRSFLGNKTLTVDSFVLGSVDDPTDGERQTGYAYGVDARYPNDTIEAGLGYREISEDFEPALGFVTRRGFRRVFGNFEYRPRPKKGPVRRYTFGLRPSVFWNSEDGEIETASYRFSLVEVLFHSGDNIEVDYFPTEERLLEPFEIVDGVVIPAGTYRFDRYSLELESSDKRPVSGRLEFVGGDFFNGERSEFAVGLGLRPRSGLTIVADYEHNRVSLPQGRFTTNLATLRLTVDFSPRLSWTSFLQFDDRSEELGTNTRIRWIIRPGRDLFLVLNKGFTTRDEGRDFTLRPTTTISTVKVAYTFRF